MIKHKPTAAGLACLFAFVLALAWSVRPADAAAWLAPGEALTAGHLEALIEPALPPGEIFAVSFTTPALPLANPARSEGQMQLLDLRYDERTERFSGRFRVRLQSGEEGVLALAGRAQAMLEIPVPTRTIAAGARIDADALDSVQIAARLLRDDTLLDPFELEGVEARRRLPAGRPIRRRDVQEPRLVRRGDAVEVLYRAPGIELVALARALEDGSRGRLVEVSNLDTGQRLAALVTGPGQVTVGTQRRVLR